MTKAWRFPYPAPNTGSVVTGLAWSSASQTISAGNDNALVTLQFNTVVENVGLAWDATNYEWEVPTDGLYLVTAAVRWDASSWLGGRMLNVYKNPRAVPTAAVLIGRSQKPAPGVDGTIGVGPSYYPVEEITNEVARPVRLVAGDRVGCKVLKRTDASATLAVAVLSDTQSSPLLSVTRLGF